MVMTPIKAVNMGLCGYNGTTMAISLVAWIPEDTPGAPTCHKE